MRTRDLLYKNIANFHQCGDPSDLSALLSYKFRSATKMYLPPEINRRTYGWNDHINPLTLSIETTSRCNARCTMCPRTTTKPVREEVLDYKKIVDLIRSTPHSVFNPSGFGEPLLDSQVPEYIRIAHDLGKFTRLTTNASLLDQPTTKALMSSGLDVFILSIDGADKETYETIRRGLKWEVTSSNVHGLRHIRRLHGFKSYIQINIVVSKTNKNQVPDIISYWFDHVDNIRTLKEARHWKEIPEEIPVRKCYAPWETMIIYSNGDVPVCCRDVEGEYVFGNVLESTPMEVWNSDKARAFRRQFQSNKPPKICRYCEIPIVDEYYKDKSGNMRSINTATRQVA